MKVEQMGTEDALKSNPTWVAWLGVRELLTPYGIVPYKNGKGTYALYVWDRECQKLNNFWHSTTRESRKLCGLTAHMKDGVLYIYEMGFPLKGTPSRRTVKKSSLDRPTSPAVKAELDRRARLAKLSKMRLLSLIFEALIGKKVKRLRAWLISQAL